MTDVFKGLNTKQREAVACASGSSVILAGAGSGKTRVLIHKVIHLIIDKKVDPSRIMMVTFTNKAAREMAERIERSTKQRVKLGFTGTFHSFCALMLRRHGEHIGIPPDYSIYDDDDQMHLMKEVLAGGPTESYSPRFFLSRISDAKNQLITPERYLEYYSMHKAARIAEVYYTYQKKLKKNKAVDFDDLIMKAVILLRDHEEVYDTYSKRFEYVLVDEFQDTNLAQYALVKLLGKDKQNVTVVGDFSQSIYSWRGADIRNLEKFTTDFPGTQVYKLEQNYRSSQQILDLAYEVISANRTHPILSLFTENAAGENIVYEESENEESEALYIADQIRFLESETPLDRIAVLYRTNAQSRALEEAFLHASIPYMLIGGTRFYERREIKDILSYLRLIVHVDDSVALERIQKLGKRRFQQFAKVHSELAATYRELDTASLIERIFAETGYLEQFDQHDPEEYSRLENIKELKSVALKFPQLIMFLEQVALVESEYFSGEKNDRAKDGVRLMTLHQAKGLEFDHVFITGLEEGILPHSRATEDPDQLEEERRLFYVGITRARKKLFITYAKRRSVFGRRTFASKSRFITKEGENEIYW